MFIINKIIVFLVQLMPKKLVWEFSKKYIAGSTLDKAVLLVKDLNSKGALATLDVLGESVDNEDSAIKAKEEILQVIKAIDSEQLEANVSIKPTQIGLSLSEDLAYQQISELVAEADKINNFIRIDMEDSPYTTSTFNLFKRIKKDYQNIGVVVQSYLKRSYDDVVGLNKDGCNYRLCKGIYIEPVEIAYKDRQEIRNNYLKILEEIFKSDIYVGIATHDEYLVDAAYELIKEYNISNNKFEFQMLLGVREDLRDKIISDGYKIRIYVPFGKEWYKYSIRRLKENPTIAGYIFNNLFSRK